VHSKRHRNRHQQDLYLHKHGRKENRQLGERIAGEHRITPTVCQFLAIIGSGDLGTPGAAATPEVARAPFTEPEDVENLEIG
jgi:hypothetical protein